MKKALLVMLLLLTSLAVSAQTRGGSFAIGQNICQVEFYAPDIVRIAKYPAARGSARTAPSAVVTMTPDTGVEVAVSDKGRRAVLSSEALTVVVDKQTGCVQFLHHGKNLLREKAFALDERTEGPDKGAMRVTQSFTLDKDEAIYGLGTIQNGRLSRRNTKVLMEQGNQEDYQCVMQSVKGWGLYWDNYSRTDFDDNAQGMTLSSEVGDGVDYYLMYGGSADRVNGLMRRLTGDVPMFPLWTFGYWQSKERYKSQDELLDVVRRYRQLHVPLDGIIQDWQYWGSNYTWNAMDFLAESFGRPQEMIDEVHRLNSHLMISIWASFGPMTPQYHQLDSLGLLFRFQTWPQSGLTFWPPRMDYPSGVCVYDAFSQAARDIYWRHLKKGLFDRGVDAWWMDSTDPDFFYPKESDYDHLTACGTWRRMRNAFPLFTVRGVYEKQRQATDSKRVFIMTRSSFAGQQHYGSNMWTGDVTSSWDVLRKQVPAGLNFTMTGNPNFNTDIGGFFCGRYNTRGPESAPRNPQYQELYVRWLQYGLFAPVFRSHGADAPREIWQFGKRGEPVYDAIEKTIRLRYRLVPYLYSTAWQCTRGDGSYLRALVSDFPHDRRVWDMPDELMFGSQILALPVVEAQYTAEEIAPAADGSADYPPVDFTPVMSVTKYLPKGAAWYDFHTEQRYEGGHEVTLSTTLDRVPMMVRAGSILPLAQEAEYVAEKAWDHLELRVYPGADADFTLYEDEGDNYNYERGLYTTIDMHWNDRTRTLTIGRRQGQYPGMLQRRAFSVHIAGEGAQSMKTVKYAGEELTLAF